MLCLEWQAPCSGWYIAEHHTRQQDGVIDGTRGRKHRFGFGVVPAQQIKPLLQAARLGFGFDLLLYQRPKVLQ